MSDTLRPRPDLGLHERAVLAGLDLLEERQTRIPLLGEVAAALDVPRDDLDRLFPDDISLLHAAAENAMIHLIEQCTRAVVLVDPADPVAQFTALGRAYLNWAHDFPRQYRLLTDGRVIEILEAPGLRRYSDAVHDVMLQMLIRAQNEGQIHAREDVRRMAITARTFAHGLARMIIDGRMREWYPDEAPLDAGLRALDDFVRRMARATLPAS